jgi:hypothetical protein
MKFWAYYRKKEIIQSECLGGVEGSGCKNLEIRDWNVIHINLSHTGSLEFSTSFLQWMLGGIFYIQRWKDENYKWKDI